MIKKINRNITQKLENKYPEWDVSVALRYLGIVKDIKKNFKDKVKILDVGSGGFGLCVYMKGKYDITGTDIETGGKKYKDIKVIKASVEKLPFKDFSYDIITSVDMMEHLPEKIRKKAVFEMVRVAKQKIYLAFPRGKTSTLIDRFLRRYYKFTHKKELDFLNEHIRYQLPGERETEVFFYEAASKFKKDVVVNKKGNTNIFLWLFLLMLGFSQVKLLTSIYHKLLYFLPILDKIHFFPTYRVVYEVNLNKK